MPNDPDYFIAPHAPDGELIGVAGRSVSQLSPKWLGFCRELLAANGARFQCAIPHPPLKHITVAVTSASGAALVNFNVRDEASTSAVALTGANPTAEMEVLRMFVDSMRRVPLVQQAAKGTSAFESVFELKQRPMYIVIPWANLRVSESDQTLVQELENHLAAALLTRPETKR